MGHFTNDVCLFFGEICDMTQQDDDVQLRPVNLWADDSVDRMIADMDAINVRTFDDILFDIEHNIPVYLDQQAD